MPKADVRENRIANNFQSEEGIEMQNPFEPTMQESASFQYEATKKINMDTTVE